MKLITGATGRVGNYLVKELNSRGERVKVLVRQNSNLKSLEGCDCEFVYGDILDVKSLEQSLLNVDVIFHLAGYINISSTEKEKTYQVNIQGTKNVVDLCLSHNLPLVYTSSIHAFDAPKDGSVITEITQLSTNEKSARGIYDYSKAAATQYVVDKMGEGLQAIILFPTGILGPNDYVPSFFGKGMIELVKAKVKNSIGGKYDYVDIRDVVNGILKAYELKKFGESYILSGEILSMKDYANYLRKLSGISGMTTILSFPITKFLGFFDSIFNKNSEITLYSVDTLNSNCNISHEKATRNLGYNPRPVLDSIRDQYEWFKANGYFA